MTSNALKKIKNRLPVVSNRQGSRLLRLDLPYLDQIATQATPRTQTLRCALVAAVDPSIRKTGWCLANWWFKGGAAVSVEFLRAGVCAQEAGVGLYPVHGMTEKITCAVAGARVLIYEYPEIYGVNKAENPNDLFPLMAVLGGLVGAGHWPVQLGFMPREWKGAVPKDVHQERELRHVPAEWASRHIPDHNAADAVLLMHLQAKTLVGLDCIVFT
jgi:hypothetical protein